MKKLMALVLVGIFVMCGLSACAFGKKKPDLAILPTIQSKSDAPNQVWVGTFQLVWNDLINELLHAPVEFHKGNSAAVDALNQQDFTVDTLSEEAYYKKFGLASKDLKKEIEKAIKEKFDEKSAILDNFNWHPAKGNYILYAMLKKDFEYAEEFSKLDKAAFKGSKDMVDYFGINKSTPKKVRNIVHVLFYNGRNDFAVSIRTKQNDFVYLYRTDDEKSLKEYYDDMMKKYRISTSNPRFTDSDELKIPNLDFKAETSFDELCHKSIKNTDLVIDKAIETVEFKMDNKGVKLKSEAGIAMMMSAFEPPSMPRYFNFDSNYVLFMQEKDKPYFAMKVSDVAKLQQ